MDRRDDNTGRQQTLGKPLPHYVCRGLPPPASSVTAVCFADIDTESYMIFGTDCGQVIHWSLDTYRSQLVYDSQHNSRVQQLIVTDDEDFGHLLLSQFKNGFIDVYDRQMTVKRSLNISDLSFCKCFLYTSADCQSKYLAFVPKSDDKSIEIMNFTDKQTMVTIEQISDKTKNGYPLAVHLTQFDTNNSKCDKILVIIGYESGLLLVFKVDPNVCDYQLVAQLKCFETIITGLDFNRDRNTGICCSVENVISVWTLTTNDDKTAVSLSLKKDLIVTNSGLTCCVIRSDGRVFACAGTDGCIRLFALKSLKPLAVADIHKKTVECLNFSHKLSTKNMKILLAVGSQDKTITLWDFYNNL
ncbi:guanine nucleotide-binding protein subunit beta-like protein 1 [Oppia nitens]|uniref:guanine nucleotide-binding protein subunit beta-like protein 1 n=1 Tax=Oppia nitens TaxID=1686743 RepID=UPI0023DCE3CB|nr:guanine nucleotide-binding protein subunit beta-like protein 1 [Oppia nitens]XP_054161625.1 guanine nucleotide-binding protein subunit beta-like protein 1 [Oppia nitens]